MDFRISFDLPHKWNDLISALHHPYLEGANAQEFRNWQFTRRQFRCYRVSNIGLRIGLVKMGSFGIRRNLFAIGDFLGFHLRLSTGLVYADGMIDRVYYCSKDESSKSHAQHAEDNSFTIQTRVNSGLSIATTSSSITCPRPSNPEHDKQQFRNIIA